MSRPSIQILKQILLLLSAGAVVAAVVNLLHPQRIPWRKDWAAYVESRARDAGLTTIPLSMALNVHKSNTHLFVDARPTAEFVQEHIAEAVALPQLEIDDHLAVLEQVLESKRPLVLYCRNRDCDDALQLALELMSLGQSNLLYYVDGFELWKEAGCPTATP